MRKVACGCEDGELEVWFDRAKSAKLLDWCNGTFLSPDEQGRLCKPSQRLSNIDVEMSGNERSWCVPGATLV